MSSLLHAADEAARLAGAVAFRHWRTGLAADTKGDGSPVTLADREAESAVRDWIHARFPQDGIIGEEFGEQAGSSGRTWLLDPIDGTRAFVAGTPLWGSLVAVMEGDTVLAGAASFPAVDEHLTAAPGEGCWHNGSRCRVSDIASLDQATVLTTDLAGTQHAARLAGWLALASKARQARTWGDCYGYLLVATGRAELMCDAILNPWDGACFVPIIAEAGGVITDWDGGPGPILASAVATNRLLAQQALAILRPQP
ncbi:MAG TPA: inositol monophosphatase family protein [Gemmatimonadales bacterium]